MPQLSTALPSPAFPHELDTISLTASDLSGAAAAEVSVTLELSPLEGTGETVTLLSTALAPDDSGRVALTAVSELLMSYLDAPGAGPMKLTVSSDGAKLGESAVIPARGPIPMSASRWVKLRPLSLLDRERTTDRERHEYLTLYAASAEEAKACRLTLTAQLPTGLAAVTLKPYAEGRLACFSWQWQRVWPRLLAERIDRFSARAKVSGSGVAPAELTYRSTARPWGGAELAYRGCFGEWETMAFASVTRKDKPTRESAVAGGRLVNYLVTPQTTWEGVSLPLSDGELYAAADLLESTYLFRPSDGVEVALTDGELETASTPTALPRLKATWREVTTAPLRGSQLRVGRTFDQTFDKTYD